MRVFVGGATGAVGRAFVAAAHSAGLDVVPHVRPRSAHKHSPPPAPAVLELADARALDGAMSGCEAVVCAIGSMRRRFHTGDTYEASDIGGARLLAEAGRRVGARRYLLVSALGAGWIPGPYYEAKRAAEAIARESGLRWTVLRPAALRGNGRRAPPGDTVLRGLGRLPGLRSTSLDARVIDVSVVAAAMLRALVEDSHLDAVVSGRELWPLAGAG